MISIFHDSAKRNAHQQFQQWRSKNPQGFFINRKTERRGLVHKTDCAHPGSSEWTQEEVGASLTEKMKVCSRSVENLLLWAQKNNLSVTSCKHCAPDSGSTDSRSRTFLVTWNPDKWHWENLDKQIAQLRTQGFVDEQWTCKTRQVQIGDRIFLLRQGPDNPGIIASGIATSQRWVDAHYSDTTKQSGYINVRWDTVLNADKEEILARQVLKQKDLQGMHWDTQSSGIVIPSEIAAVLEVKWATLLFEKGHVISRGPDDVHPSDLYWEGSVRQITVNAYERDPHARQACIEHYGAKCSACGMSFELVYGPIGKDFIHVHHVRALASIRKGYKVHPIKDLRPVCPNCHAIIHRHNPTMTVEDLAALLKKSSGR